ncbi:MAG: hypothetical protein H0Z28_13430 [Archaeoglobus sp.]|nr:hypothetical protein [Archaeoglobus sp.]
MKVQVIRPARLNGVDIEPGKIVDLDNQLANNWIRLGFGKPIGKGKAAEPNDSEKATGEDTEWPKPLGAGWYQLPNGEKVQGKKKAIEAVKELKET